MTFQIPYKYFLQFSVFGVNGCRRFEIVGDGEYGDKKTDHKTNTGEKFISLKCGISKNSNNPWKIAELGFLWILMFEKLTRGRVNFVLILYVFVSLLSKCYWSAFPKHNVLYHLEKMFGPQTFCQEMFSWKKMTREKNKV